MQLHDRLRNRQAKAGAFIAMPALKAMAQKIIDDQEREITEMRDWLKKNKR